MDSSVSGKDEIWFLRVCYHVPHELYKPTTTYDAIPVSKGKRLLEEYYTRIWNETYTNSEKGSHTKTFIPSILHRMTLTLWPNHVLTQFLTNDGCFRSLQKEKGAYTTTM